MFVQAWRWFVDRFGLGPIWDTVLDRQVPKDPWYHGDGMALLVLLTVLVITGITLASGYCPSMDESYSSVQHITHDWSLGWIVRGLHYWSGGLMVVMVFLHLCRQLLLGGYKAPREATWQTGVVLLAIVLATSLLGYVLRWDMKGLYGLQVATAAMRNVPYIGETIVAFVIGGSEITSLTLTRIYAMHVVIVPLLLLLLVGYHVYLVILHGTTTLAERDEPIETVEEQRELYQAQKEHPVKGEVFFPTAVMKISPLSLLSLFAAMSLTLALGPPDLMQPANLTESVPAREEWWFAWYSGLIAILPANVAPWFRWFVPLGAFVFLMLLPLIDRSPHRGWRNRPVATTLVVILVLSVLSLSWLRYRSHWNPDLTAGPPEIPPSVILSADAEFGRQLFPKYGCTNCHSVAGYGRAHIGPDLAQIDHLYSQSELRHYILHPPPNVAMPAYWDHVSETDLDRLAAFVLVAQTFPRKLE